jgi:hypothetical protein
MRRWVIGVVLGAVFLAAAGPLAAKGTEERHQDFQKGRGRIRGYLIDPAGNGLRGVVALCTAGGGTLSVHNAFRAEKGEFVIDGIRPGTYRLHIDTLGPETGSLAKPADVEVVVRANQTARPKIVVDTE